jgi:hypothetical protein
LIEGFEGITSEKACEGVLAAYGEAITSKRLGKEALATTQQDQPTARLDGAHRTNGIRPCLSR